MWRYFREKWQSLIFRLLLYFLLAIMALAIIVALSFAKRWKPHFENELLPNVERYIGYLIEDIGQPPDLGVAQRLAADLPIEIRIIGPGLDWTSSPLIRSADAYHLEPAPPPYADVFVGHNRRDEILLVQRAGYQYLFALDNGFRQRSERRHWILFLLIGATLFVLYLAIRRLFRPIGAISRQVDSIAQGDLEQSIEVRGKGELALLAAGVNRMSRQIKNMLESKSGLLLAISHELRSPLTRMRVNLELLDAGDIQRKLIEDVREMESLLAAILESEKLNSQHAPLNRSRCELPHLIEAVIRSHPCRQRIRSELTPLAAGVDELRLSLLLKNLIDNACQYSADDSPIELRLARDGDFAEIRVSDQGIGIAPEVLPHLTEAFFRPDSARQRQTGGYGLGLYLCRLIVDAHGGRMSFDSEPGKGTRVTVKLPIDNS